ncbi:MAG TPA: Flp pilus assembly protein CpaB [Candidatus Dormibacteraeota bacterium]
MLVAVAAGGGVFLYGTLFGGGGGGVLSGGVTVVVAAQAIPVRHQITDADLTTTKISPNLPNTYTQTKDVKGLISELFISKGSLITSDMLARDVGLIPAGSAPAYLPLASGYVAMTIPTGEQQGVAGHITLGDYITVIASASVVVPPAPAKVVTKTVFTNIHIIGLGPAVANVQPAAGAAAPGGTQGTTSGLTSSLTIEVSQCDAEFFTWFLQNMTVRYTLESFNDYLKQPPTTPDPTCQTIKDAHGVSFKQIDDRYGFSKL